MESPPLSFLHGTLHVLVLHAVATQARHGYDIAEWIRSRSRGAILVEEGVLYPALHRLEERGWLEAEWGVSASNRKAKYYWITARGRRQLRNDTVAWLRHVEAVSAVLQPA